jgi:hypothetical protein
MTRTRFDLIDSVNSVEIYRVDGKSVESVRRQRDDLASMKAIDNLGDEIWFGLVWMNAECFSRQIWLLFRCYNHLAP